MLSQSAKSIISSAALFKYENFAWRNIVSRTPSVAIHDNIAQDELDLLIAQAMELEKRPIQFQSHTPIIDRPFEQHELESELYRQWTDSQSWDEAVAYPFAHVNEGRFNPKKFAAWYGSSEELTTIFETAYHWLRQSIDDYGDLSGVKMRQRAVHKVQVDGWVLDLRGQCDEYPLMLDKSDYSTSHAVAREAYATGCAGVWVKSARNPKGCNLVMYRPGPLKKSQFARYLEYRLTANHKTIQVKVAGGSKNSHSIAVAQLF
jgi:hypothetical protein